MHSIQTDGQPTQRDKAKHKSARKSIYKYVSPRWIKAIIQFIRSN